MAEKDTLSGAKVKHKGIFSFKDAYAFLHGWLINEGYDINEKTYKENIGAGGVKEIEIEWDAMRKITDYFRFHIKVKFHIIGMTDVEVEVDGKKQKMNKGTFEMRAKAVLEKDWESRWENKAFFKFLRTLYDRYLVPARIDKYEGKLLSEHDEFMTQAKSFLSLSGMR
jgi:hypothetical protein